MSDQGTAEERPSLSEILRRADQNNSVRPQTGAPIRPKKDVPNIAWEQTVQISMNTSAKLHQLIASLLNARLDAMKDFEGRDRFEKADIQAIYHSLPFFVDTKYLYEDTD